ncbi:MAG: glycosyltransferase, partial [Longimicrobiales bacterium]|nr:glycosyltransferase [Longimicrobiales bacterium]
FTGGGARNRFYEWLQRRSFRRMDAVVAVSEALRRELEAGGVPAAHVHLVRNAWSPPADLLVRAAARAALGLPAGATDQQPLVGWVGRMTEEKAPDVALRAFLDLAGRVGPSAPHLVLVGDGRMRAALAAEAAASGAGDRVHFPGVVPDAGRLLKAFDVLILSSWTEGTPMVLLEAMAAEVPVVTTAVGGIPDVVSDAEAHLVPAGDVSGLARALEDVMTNGAAAAERAAAARRRLERDLSVEDFAHRYGEIYRACLMARR